VMACSSTPTKSQSSGSPNSLFESAPDKRHTACDPARTVGVYFYVEVTYLSHDSAFPCILWSHLIEVLNKPPSFAAMQTSLDGA
jgi:hypothetical protein